MGEFMKDTRVQCLARQAIRFSVALQSGEKILIDAVDGAEDFVTALVEEAYAVGGLPFIHLQNQRVNRALISNCTEENISLTYEFEVRRMREMDAYIVIRKRDNMAELSDVMPENLQIYNYYDSLLHHGERIRNTKWCVLRYPNDSMAQAAGMSTEAFEDYFFAACCIDYARFNQLIRPLTGLVKKTDRVCIKAPGTELTFSIKGMGYEEPICGKNNLPCGEVGIPVIPESVNGSIAYNIPSFFQGCLFRDIHFHLENGRIVKATSSENTERLNRILDTDENARRIGEFAVSFNPYITEPILDTLFDEKMAKSIHFTPGNSLVNPSAIHWDIVQSHAAEYGGGEIWFDGVLIRKDGLFIPEALQQLNPELLKAAVSAYKERGR